MDGTHVGLMRHSRRAHAVLMLTRAWRSGCSIFGAFWIFDFWGGVLVLWMLDFGYFGALDARF